jgi:signal transduction histidine kinase
LLLPNGARPALLAGSGYVGFQLFALGAAWLARREADARAELARVNAALTATQSLLAGSSRAAERLRISRELHDALGHHLTALSLQLEVARNTAPDNPAVRTAQDIARTMLGEVRAGVSALRSDQPIDLRTALTALAAGVPGLSVHLSVTDELCAAVDAPTALALFRCAQEALTNAARHARAKNLWIDITVVDGRARLSVRDDGRGAQSLTHGNGLRGLVERLREVGGIVDVESAPGQGVRLTASVPLPRGEVVA